MELEFRQFVGTDGINSCAVERMGKNDNILFCWCIVSAALDEEFSFVLLPMIIQLWVTIRGYSLCSAWMEKYKVAQKKTVQKSKSLRKKIVKE